MKINDTLTAIDCCFRVNKQHAMTSPHCENCPYYAPKAANCVEQLLKDVKFNLKLVQQLLDENAEQRTELRHLRSLEERRGNYD